MQVLELELLKQDPTVPVNDRLRQAGSPGREENPQRVIERHLLEHELRSAHRRVVKQLGPVDDTLSQHTAVDIDDGDAHDCGQVPQTSNDALDLSATVVQFSAVPVAVNGDQHLGLELTEPVHGASGTKVG